MCLSFEMHISVLPTVSDLYVTAGSEENEKKRKATQRRAERQQKKYSVDVATETPEQREARINRHLKNYSDKRFDIIDTCMSIRDASIRNVIRMSINCLYAGWSV